MTNTIGHGHVRPRDDGYKARCGGPAICGVCQSEERRARPRTAGKPPYQPMKEIKMNEENLQNPFKAVSGLMEKMEQVRQEKIEKVLTDCAKIDSAADNDFPLGPACDLSGEGHCTACE